ncbi:hypothetical protein SLEP1_g60562 [Rubroshorea leprosula]|uniref:Uncharacterized protein n=1 Tax=Rubroshorea leprosula TaxID=152421 RepID=A0AAV5MWQ7_9ROSI|nr:hypothetical protein SLEP1_g60562 [Rubroshorea leprosula]
MRNVASYDNRRELRNTLSARPSNANCGLGAFPSQDMFATVSLPSIYFASLHSIKSGDARYDGKRHEYLSRDTLSNSRAGSAFSHFSCSSLDRCESLALPLLAYELWLGNYVLTCTPDTNLCLAGSSHCHTDALDEHPVWLMDSLYCDSEASRSVLYPTRLETRTKESNIHASRTVLNRLGRRIERNRYDVGTLFTSIYPKDGELCPGKMKPEETLVEVCSDSDVQIDRQIRV